METTVITRISQILRDLSKNLECPICLHTVSHPQRTRCRHLFCATCIGEILSKKGVTCPLCKASLTRRSIYPDRQAEIALRHFQTLINAIKEDTGIDISQHSRIPGHTKESNSPEKHSKKPRRRSHSSNLDKKLTESSLREATSRSSLKFSDTKENAKTNETTLISYEDPNDYLAYPSSSHDTRYGCPLSTEPQLNELNSNKRRPLRQANTTSKETAKSRATKEYSDRDEENLSEIATNSADVAELPKGSLQKSGSGETNKRVKPQIRSITVLPGPEPLSPQKISNTIPITTSDISRKTSFSENTEAHDKSTTLDKSPSSDMMMSSSEKNWSQVTIFGKEMRRSKRKLKALDVSIESTSKVQELNKVAKESALGVAKEPQRRIVNTKKENDPNTTESKECSSRGHNRPLESNESLPNIESTYRKEQSAHKKRQEEIHPMDSSFTSDIGNESTKSLFITSRDGARIPIKTLNHDQMQEIIGRCDDVNNFQANQIKRSGNTSTPSKDQCHDIDGVSSPMVSPVRVLDNCTVETNKEKRSNTSRTQLQSRSESANTPHQMKSLSLTETPKPRGSLNRNLVQSTSTTNDTPNTRTNSELFTDNRELATEVTTDGQSVEISRKNNGNSSFNMQQEEKENHMETSSDLRGVIFKKLGRVVKRRCTLLQNPCKFLYLGSANRAARTTVVRTNSILNSLKPPNPIDTQIKENDLGEPSSQKNSSGNAFETTLNDTVISKPPIEASNSRNNSIRNTSPKDTVKTSLVKKNLEDSKKSSTPKNIASQNNDVKGLISSNNSGDVDVIFVSQVSTSGNGDPVHMNDTNVRESHQPDKDFIRAIRFPEARMKTTADEVTSSTTSPQLELQRFTDDGSWHNTSAEKQQENIKNNIGKDTRLSESRVRGAHSKALIRRSQKANIEDSESDLRSNVRKKPKYADHSDSSSASKVANQILIANSKGEIRRYNIEDPKSDLRSNVRKKPKYADHSDSSSASKVAKQTLIRSKGLVRHLQSSTSSSDEICFSNINLGNRRRFNVEDSKSDLRSNVSKKRKFLYESDSSSENEVATPSSICSMKTINDLESDNNSDSEIRSDTEHLRCRRRHKNNISSENDSTDSGTTVLIEVAKSSENAPSDNASTAISSPSDVNQKKRKLSPDSDDGSNGSEIVRNWCNNKYSKIGKVDVKQKPTVSSNLLLKSSETPLTRRTLPETGNIVNNQENLTAKNLDNSSVENRDNHDGNVIVEEDEEFNYIIDRVREIRRVGTNNSSVSNSGSKPNTEQRQSSQESLFGDKDDEIIANIDTQAFVNGQLAIADKKREILAEEDTNDTNTTRKPSNDSLVQKVNTSKHDSHNISDFNEKENGKVQNISNTKTIVCDESFSTRIPTSDTVIENKRLSEGEKVEINQKESIESAGSNNDKSTSQDILMNCSTERKERSYVQDSLGNVTEDEERLRQFEEDLFGSKKSGASPKTATATGFAGNKSLEDHKGLPQKDYNEPEVVGLPAKDSEHSSWEDDIVESTPERKTGNCSSTLGTLKTRQSAVTPSDLSPFSKHIGNQSTIAISSSRKSTTGLSTPTCETGSIHPLHHSTPKPYRVTTKEPQNSQSIQQNKLTRSNTDTNAYIMASRQSNGNNAATNRNLRETTQKLCFVCSSLGSSQIECVKKLAVLLNAEYTAQFRPDVSHLIVRADPQTNAADKTLKYLQGIAYGKWVIGFRWVEECLRQGKMINEESYEVVDAVTLESSSRLSRLAKKPLFDGFAFHCIGPYVDISVEQYKDLLHVCGGVVVDTLENLAKLTNLLKIIVIQSDTHDDKIIINWHQKTQAVPIGDDWVVECIGQYKLLSLHPFLHQLSAQDLLAIGFPNTLVEEVLDDYGSWDSLEN